MEKNLKKLLYDFYKESYMNENSTRSTKRLELLHGYIKSELNNITNESKIIWANDGRVNSKEYSFKGPLNDKNIDIAIVDNEKIQSAISVKFAWSNYKQNAINYYEQMIAESLNLKLGGCESYQLVIIRRNFPYFSNGKKELSKIEKITNESLIKRYKRVLESDFEILNGLCVMVVDFQDLEILEKYKNYDFFSIEKLLYELTNSINEERIKIEYPLVEKGIKGALTFEELISNSIK